MGPSNSYQAKHSAMCEDEHISTCINQESVPCEDFATCGAAGSPFGRDVMRFQFECLVE